MIRENFWLNLKREPGQSVDSWVNTVCRMAQECEFPESFRDQAIRDKLTFSCHDDSIKLKLYDEGASLQLDKVIKLLSLREATSKELKETKSSTIDHVSYHKRSKNTRVQKSNSSFGKNKTTHDHKECKFCGQKHRFSKRHCPAADKECGI